MWAHFEHHHPGHGTVGSPARGMVNRGIDGATDRGGRYIAGSDMCHSTHAYDLARYMLGEPVEVYALRNPCCGFADITFAGGAVAQVQSGGASGKGLSHVTPVMIQGTDGTIYTHRLVRERGKPPEQVAFLMNSNRKGAKLRQVNAKQVSSHADDVRAGNFLDALTKGAPLICDLEDSVRTSELLHAIWTSYSLGIRVPIRRAERTG